MASTVKPKYFTLSLEGTGACGSVGTLNPSTGMNVNIRL
jgi:hypothetical protein